MTYEEAIAEAKEGTTVKRSVWKNRTVSLATDGAGDSQLISTETRTIKAPYLATQEDMFANDWTT